MAVGSDFYPRVSLNYSLIYSFVAASCFRLNVSEQIISAAQLARATRDCSSHRVHRLVHGMQEALHLVW